MAESNDQNQPNQQDNSKPSPPPPPLVDPRLTVNSRGIDKSTHADPRYSVESRPYKYSEDQSGERPEK